MRTERGICKRGETEDGSRDRESLHVVKTLHKSVSTKSKVRRDLVLSSEADCDFYRNG